MRKFYFIFAGLVALTITALFPTPIKAAPTSGAFAPIVDSDVISVARRCWRRANGRLICTYVRPYWQPYGYYPAYRYGYYGYSNLGPYYQPYYPRFYLPGYYYRPYG